MQIARINAVGKDQNIAIIQQLGVVLAAHFIITAFPDHLVGGRVDDKDHVQIFRADQNGAVGKRKHDIGVAIAPAVGVPVKRIFGKAKIAEMLLPDNPSFLINLSDHLSKRTTIGLASRLTSSDRRFLGIGKFCESSVNGTGLEAACIVMLPGVFMRPDETAITIIFRHPAADCQRNALVHRAAPIRKRMAVWQQIAPVGHTDPACPAMGILTFGIFFTGLAPLLAIALTRVVMAPELNRRRIMISLMMLTARWMLSGITRYFLGNA